MEKDKSGCGTGSADWEPKDDNSPEAAADRSNLDEDLIDVDGFLHKSGAKNLQNMSAAHIKQRNAPENDHQEDLSFEENDPLVNKSMHVKNGQDSFNISYEKSPKGRETNADSESLLSMRHLSEGGKAMRTTDPVSSQFNMLNMYVGIALIALPKAVSEVGFAAAILGILVVNLLSLGASYFLLKARNRFKKQRIIDFPDMAMACFGPATKRFSECILILANTTFVMAQGMYLGGQADLFACDYLDRPDECGQHRNFYSFAMLAILSPLLLIRDFKKLGAYSGFFIMCCVLSIALVFIFEIATIYGRQQGQSFEMTYSDESGKVVVASEEKLASAFDYDYFNYAALPLFMGEVMSIFEGNVGILNLYSQQNQPRSMFTQTVITHIVVGACCLLMGTLSYLAYGELVQDIVLYNLPHHSKLATLVAALYMLNVVGSITMTIQPIYGLFEKAEKKDCRDSLPQRDLATQQNGQAAEASTVISGGDEVVPAAPLESEIGIDFFFYLRRLVIPFVIIALSTFFPNVNMILSLLGGSICGVCFIVMPVFFYKAAYVTRPSKKNRCCQIWLGNLIVAITLPIGILGVFLNLAKMMEAPEGQTASES